MRRNSQPALWSWLADLRQGCDTGYVSCCFATDPLGIIIPWSGVQVTPSLPSGHVDCGGGVARGRGHTIRVSSLTFAPGLSGLGYAGLGGGHCNARALRVR